MSDPKRLISVTDASPEIGLGHAMRQLSLAQAARRHGWSVHWYSPSPEVEAIAETHAIPHTRLSTLDDVCPRIEREGSLIIDVHQRDFPRLRCGKASAHATLMVSEVGYDFSPYGNHVVFVGRRLDQWTATHMLVHEFGGTQEHSGRAWTIFSEEFATESVGETRRSNHVLVCHGGSDPRRLTELTLQALALVERQITITVLVTDAFPAISEVELLANSIQHPCEVVRNTASVRGFMEQASIAVINGGNVRYELCLSGTPYVAVSFQEKQYECTQQLSRQGVGVNLGLMKTVTPSILAAEVTELLDDYERRKIMEAEMKMLFDPFGADRVLNLFTGGEQ